MQQFMLSQLFSSNGLMYAVFLGGMFAVVAFRKESIAIPGMFKLAYSLFALAVVLPACMLPVFAAMGNISLGQVQSPVAGDLDWVVNAVYSGTGPALFALSVVCAFGSMFPRKLRTPPSVQPTKHPLD